MEALRFSASEPLTMGVELELQILNTRDCNLTRGAADLLALIEKNPHPGDIKPEITESMIEISTSIHAPMRPCWRSCWRSAKRSSAGRRAAESAASPAVARIRSSTGASGASSREPRFQHLQRALRLSRQAVHGVRPAHPHRLSQTATRRCTWLHGMSRYIPHFIALVRLFALLAGRGHAVRVVAPERRERVSAVRHMPFVRDVERVQRVLREHAGLRHRREHEGLLLGHPPQARIRHDRDPRLRYAAHGGARRAARGLCADASRVPAARAADRSRPWTSTACTATTASWRAASDSTGTLSTRRRASSGCSRPISWRHCSGSRRTLPSWIQPRPSPSCARRWTKGATTARGCGRSTRRANR